MYKTINCGDVGTEQISRSVTLAGWVHRRRDHGNLIFIDLRDRDGIVQIVFNPESAPDAHRDAESLRNEWVIQVTGAVVLRPEGTENPNLPSGQVEVSADRLVVLNESKTPPFYVNEDSEVDELLRLKYRYLDLRRAGMRESLVVRHRVVKFIRDFLDQRDFLEIETPIPDQKHSGGRAGLPRSQQTSSRPVSMRFPSRLSKLKQLLMVAGVEKYFQIARCFRDEDLRADRQPEHTQLDLEMSFVEEDDVLDLIEELFTSLVDSMFPERWILRPFPRNHLRGGHGAIWHRQAGPALRPRDGGHYRHRRRHRLSRLPLGDRSRRHCEGFQGPWMPPPTPDVRLTSSLSSPRPMAPAA